MGANYDGKEYEVDFLHALLTQMNNYLFIYLFCLDSFKVANIVSLLQVMVLVYFQEGMH